jgi:NADPH:quinone reductase-like Zn-dependent oxidoreductase
MTVEAPARNATMKAVVHHRYGAPDVLELSEIEKPALEDNGVLVRVHVASLNRLDWYGLNGTPWVGRVAMGWRRPKDPRIGVDFAGTVEAVGKDVTRFRPGDEVFGGRTGALAEYVHVLEDRAIAPKPAGITFEQAATIPVAGLTALQALRDKGQLQAGQKVLVHGASGGVGTFAVTLAKELGAEVTAVCSTANVDIARSLGADHVVDYTREDVTRSGRRYDLVVDVAGGRSWSAFKRILAPEATFVIVGGPKKSRLLGPIGGMARLRLGAIGSRRKVIFFIAKMPPEDLTYLAELVDSGRATPVIDRRYELSEVADALRYMGDGHPRGKVVVSI